MADMSTDAGFLDDICEHPDDDTPRLVYADWLEDHGQADRAEFIRAQCGAARLAEEDPERDRLEDRARALREQHSAAWLASLPGFARKQAVFRRGFVEKITVKSTQFVKKAKDLFAAAPIREAALTYGYNFSNAPLPDPDLAACAYLARLTALRIGGYKGRIGDEGVRTLVASPHLAGLKRLDLADCGIEADGVRAVAESLHLAGLESLDLSGAPLGDPSQAGDEGALLLAASPHLSNLRELSLKAHTLGGEGAAALVSSPRLSNLVRLDISYNRFIGPEGGARLVASVNLPHLQALNLGWANIGSRNVEALFSSGRLPALQDVDLEYCDLDLLTLGRICNSPAGARLRRLALDNLDLGDAMFARLAPLRLRSLVVANNQLGPEGARALADLPLLEGLRELNLDWNDFGDDGAAALAASPRAANLRVLHLGSNTIGLAGARALAASEHLAGLRELHLWGNKLGNAGAESLIASPHLRRLTTLRLHSNRIFKSMKPALEARFGKAASI
jgi:uncharacterized protein (TIGR02996 family)